MRLALYNVYYYSISSAVTKTLIIAFKTQAEQTRKVQ